MISCIFSNIFTFCTVAIRVSIHNREEHENSEKSVLGAWSQLRGLVWLELEDIYLMFWSFLPLRCHPQLCMYSRGTLNNPEYISQNYKTSNNYSIHHNYLLPDPFHLQCMIVQITYLSSVFWRRVLVCRQYLEWRWGQGNYLYEVILWLR